MSLIPDDVHNYYEELLQQHIQALELHLAYFGAFRPPISGLYDR